MTLIEPPEPIQTQGVVMARWLWPIIGLGASTLAGWMVYLLVPNKGQVAKLIAIMVATVVLIAILHHGLISPLAVE